MKICGQEIRIDGRFVRLGRLAAERYEFVDEPERTIQALKISTPRVDVFTFIQKLPHTSPLYSYQLEWDNVAAIPVSTYDNWWSRQINGKTRNMVRRAASKGVVVREVPFDDTLLEGICRIYDESPVRQGRPFWHYKKGRDVVRRENSTFLDQSVFIGAFVGDVLIGFAKLVIEKDRSQASLMQILSLIAERDRAPANALVAFAVKACAERGIPHLVYANFAYGSKQRDSLSDFKQHNGFQRIEVPRYYVPLTAVGRAALRFGLHKGVVTRVPEPVLDRLRSIRRRWYDAGLLRATHAR